MFQGLRVMRSPSVVSHRLASGIAVVPTMTAPAARSRATTGWSSLLGIAIGGLRAGSHDLAGDRDIVFHRNGHAGEWQIAHLHATRR